MKYRFLYSILMLLILASPALSAPTVYVYDELDRLHRVYLENGQKITYEYDKIGNMTSKTLGTWCPVGYTYNATRDHCEKAPDCAAGATYDSILNQCVGDPACNSGVYDVTTNQCQSVSSYPVALKYSCPLGGTLNDTTCSAGSYAATLSGGTTYNLPIHVTWNWECSEVSFSAGSIYGYAATSSMPGGVPLYQLPAAFSATLNVCASSDCLSINAFGLGSVILRGYLNPAQPDATWLPYYGDELGGCGRSQWNGDTFGGPDLNGIHGFIPQSPGVYGGAYTCPSGGTPSGSTCNISAYSASPYYSCPSGGIASGSTCNITTSVSATCTTGILDVAIDKCIANPTCTIGTLDTVLDVCWTY